jgi:Uma2 family endonuclease
MPEIILPETKPALEWVNGRALQKVSPKRKHSNAQTVFAVALRLWASERRVGMVGTEWRFQVKPQGEDRRPLVPDVAFLSYKTLPRSRLLSTEVPRVAPDAVVEILSVSDRAADVAEKLRVYLKAGSKIVFVVDPENRTVTMHDAQGSRVHRQGEVLKHPALPGFRLAVKRLFELP